LLALGAGTASPTHAALLRPDRWMRYITGPLYIYEYLFIYIYIYIYILIPPRI